MEQKNTEPAQVEKPELRPDGWERFEKAVDIATKTPAIRKDANGKPSINKRKP